VHKCTSDETKEKKKRKTSSGSPEERGRNATKEDKKLAQKDSIGGPQNRNLGSIDTVILMTYRYQGKNLRSRSTNQQRNQRRRNRNESWGIPTDRL